MRVLECVPQGAEGIEKKDLEAALGADVVKVCMVYPKVSDPTCVASV